MPSEVRGEGSNERPTAHLDLQRNLVCIMDALEGSRIASLETPEIFRDGISYENATFACLPEGNPHRREGRFPCPLRRDVATLGDVMMQLGLAARVTSQVEQVRIGVLMSLGCASGWREYAAGRGG